MATVSDFLSFSEVYDAIFTAALLRLQLDKSLHETVSKYYLLNPVGWLQLAW